MSCPVRCEWGPNAPAALAPVDVVVIVDVLSFSTTVDVAVSRGARVWPYRQKQDAAAFAASIGAEVAGPRGSRWSLSPASFLEAPPGLRCVLPSPNGATITLAAAETGAVVLAGCLRNASAVAGAAAGLGRTFAVVPAGERWPDGSLRPCLEDLLGAGAILRRLPGARSPEADAAVAAFERCELAAALAACPSGRELADRGYAGDVALAAELDASSVVPRLTDGAYGGA